MKIALDTAVIKERRMDMRWSQEDFAAAAGVGVRTIQRAESSGVVSLETAKALSSALNEDLTMLESTEREISEHPSSPRWGVYAGLAGGLGGAAIGLFFAVGALGISPEALLRLNAETGGGLFYGLAGAGLGLLCAGLGLVFGKR